jgi:hypothetical protein
MFSGMFAAQMRAAAGAPAALWTPLNMATVPQIYLDAQDSVVTDVSGACSAISNLGAMGANGDFSQATAGNRPTILAAELNGKRVLRFDGVNDGLTGGSTAQADLFRNKGSAWVFTIHKKRTTDAGAVTRVILASSTAGGTEARFAFYHGFSSTALNTPRLLGKRLDADAYGIMPASTAYSGSYNIMMAHMNYATRLGQIYVDGVVIVANATLTTAGNTSDTAAGTALTIGAWHTGTLFSDIDLAAMVIGNTAPSAPDIEKLEGWAAHKYGLTANLPVAHPYKTTAPTVIDPNIGITWTSRTSAADNNWRSVAWSPSLSLFVAVANSGTGDRVMTSPDGIAWTIRTSAADNNWVDVVWSPERSLFVAVANTGTGNRVMTSPDGINWTIRTTPADNSWFGVAWSPSLLLFVAVAYTGTGNRVMTSPDGIAWTIRTSAADNGWVDVAWSPSLSLFVAVAISGTGNRVMTSPDGINWTTRTSAADNNWVDVIWSPERSLFVAVANTGTGDRVMTSPNGTTWTSRTSATDNNWSRVIWSPERSLFVAVANTGTGNRVMTSPDGITWTSRTSAADNSWLSIAWSPSLSRFVAVANTGTGDRVMTSL